jgi:diaminohydroxyphosphoribosylaminopyrimidine deaminase/5-amino-6-(5-phosphoribosylamino)uracil reductase
VDDHSRDQLNMDEVMMRRALDLARRGTGYVSPNPMVGALIIDADGGIIAEGWHERFGGPHAEINALRAAEGRDLSQATLYVTLEPCNHYGKTPPCTDAIVASGIRRVVVAMRDPNPIVSGRGNKILREAGIEVTVGVLEKEAQMLNESYIHFTKTGRPFVTVKVAQTLDGFMALPNKESQWITGELARVRGHMMRAAADAVMIGSGTAREDDPSLTVRYGVQGRNPRRIVLDEDLSLPGTLKLFTDGERDRTIVITTRAMLESPRALELKESGVKVFGVAPSPQGVNLDEVLKTLGELNIASVLVEGGALLAGSMIKEELADKVVVFIAPKLIGHGLQPFAALAVAHLADAHVLDVYRVETVGEDVMVTAYWHRG